jgi:hypothetical protein
MNQYIQYKIDNGEYFQPKLYPQLLLEMASLQKGIATFPGHFRSDIIISFLKDHSLRLEWIKENPELTSLLTSGCLLTRNIESLFEAGRFNRRFSRQFEDYLREELK